MLIYDEPLLCDQAATCQYSEDGRLMEVQLYS